MPKIIIRSGQSFCEQCGKEVPVIEKPGQQNAGQLLVCANGHVVAQRTSSDQPWDTAA